MTKTKSTKPLKLEQILRDVEDIICACHGVLSGAEPGSSVGHEAYRDLEIAEEQKAKLLKRLGKERSF